MNRRSFLRNSALALFGFTVLPPAETYQRVWRAEYRCIMERPVVLEYRANGIGIYQMLREEGVRISAQSEPAVDILNFFDEVNAARKMNRNPPEIIEVFTNTEGVRYLKNYARSR